MRWALVALVGCGRIGFNAQSISPSGDSGNDVDAIVVPANQILIHTLANCDVVVEGGARYKTDANGDLLIPATAPTSFHVVAPNKSVFSALSVDPGAAVSLGRNKLDQITAGFRMNGATLDVTPIADVDYFTAAHGVCAPSSSSSATITVLYYMPCASAVFDMVVLATQGGTVVDYLDSDPIAIKSGTTTASQTWLAAPTYSLSLVNASPFEGMKATANLFRREPDHFGDTPLGGSGLAVTVTGGSAAMAVTTAPFADEIYLSLTTPAYSTSNLVFTPASLAPGNTTLDASKLLPPMSGLVVDANSIAATWTAPPDSPAQLVAFDATIQIDTGQYRNWEIYAPASTTSVTFPTLPADLDEPFVTPLTYYSAEATLVEAVGLDRRAAWAVADLGRSDFAGAPIDAPTAGFATSQQVLPPYL